MPRILCVVSLIAFIAINSVNSQDIDPQFIPRPSTVKGPEIEDTTTTTVIDEDISTTTEGATTSTTLDVQTVTEPIPTVEIFPVTTTNEAVASTSTTETTTPATDSTTTTPAIIEDTTKKVVTTTTIRPTSRIPQRPPQGRGPSVLCRTIIQHGPLSYNRFYGIFTIPKTCYYCCRTVCTEDIGIERCTEISPFYCSLRK